MKPQGSKKLKKLKKKAVSVNPSRSSSAHNRLQLSSSVAGNKASKNPYKWSRFQHRKDKNHQRVDGVSQLPDLFNSFNLSSRAAKSTVRKTGHCEEPSSSGTETNYNQLATNYPDPCHTPVSAWRMSLDRARSRDLNMWNRKDFKDFSSDNIFIDSGPSDQYIDFTEDWPDPRGPVSYTDRSNYRWQHNRDQWSWNNNEGDSYGGEQMDFRRGSLPEDFCQDWGPGMQDWQNEGHTTWAQPRGNFRGRHMPPQGKSVNGQRQSMGNQQEKSKTGRNSNNHWNNFAKQFSNTSFHRQDMNESIEGELNISNSSSLRGGKSGSSGLEDSFSSGGGKKRPRSLEREGNLPKSSRAENPRAKSATSVLLNSSRALSLSDLTGKEVQKQGPTIRPKITNKGQGATKTGPASQQAGPLGKKKQVGPKTKVTSVVASKTTVGSAEQEGETSGEGVLERAERMCQELREKRQQAMHMRAAASSGQRVAALRSALNTSVRHFNSAHKSFLKGCKSDSGSVSSGSASTKGGGTHVMSSLGPAVGGGSISTAQKHFSSSTSSVDSQKVTSRPKSASSFTTHPQDSRARSGASTPLDSSSQVGNIERIRISIESSVRAEEKRARPTVRGPSSSLSHSPPSSAVQAMIRRKPPLPLSKDALAKMVSAPRSRTQRLQLSRMLRQHSTTTTVRPRRVHLDGLYDNTDEDGDSIEDVLKNISGLEEIGDCAELKNIKLEDLTNEDKLRIAQLIEDVDISDRDRQLGVNEPGDRAASACLVMCSDSSDREGDVSIVSEQSDSHLRHRAMSPVPSQPLSMDDLNTERTQRITLPVTVRSPSRLRSLIIDSHPPSVAGRSSPVNFASSTQNSADKGTEPVVEDTPMDVPNDTHVSDSGLESIRDANYRSPSPVRSQATAPMETSQVLEPGSHSSESRAVPRSLGVMHEVMSLCQQQDTVMAEMKDIDVELSQMYKSLIEIVARMSGLQRRRVQLQSEGEQLSQQRNHLLSGLAPEAISTASGSRISVERRPHFTSTSATSSQNAHSGLESSVRNENAMESSQGRAPIGSSVTLPRWLSAPSPSRQQTVERGSWNLSRTESIPSAGEKTPDVCLSGNVTPKALSRTPSFRSSVDSAHDAEDHGSNIDLLSRPSSAGAANYSGRPMLSIHGIIEKDTASGEKETANSSLAEISAARSSVIAESSSGLGSSISTQANSGQPPDTSLSDQPSLHDSSSTLTSAASSQSKQPAQPASEGRLIFNTLTSPQPSRTAGAQAGDVIKSPGVGIAYLGSLSSDLVQQIVRNLPITSQLGEAASRPSMFMLKPGNPAAGSGNSSSSQVTADADTSARRRATSIDSNTPAAAKSRTRTTSLHSVPSHELSSGEENLSASVPLLKLSGASDKGGCNSAKSCNETPRSESDTHSCTSGTSLGEQIKLFSERNTSSMGSMSFHGTSFEDGFSVEDMANCSVVLDRIDSVRRDGLSPSFKIEDDDTDRPKKRKTKKDRNQSLHRRKQFAVNSSSEGEEVSGEETGEDERRNSLPDILSSPQQHGVHSKEIDHLSGSDSEEVDMTLVDAEQLSYKSDDQKEDCSSSRLKLNPERLQNFRALLQRNMTSSPFDPSTTSKGKEKLISAVKKNTLKISGTCTPVIGLEIHGNLLYVGYHGEGVNSYTLAGQFQGEYTVPSAQCFTVAPTGSSSQHLVAVGGQDQLIFLSTANQFVIESVDTTAMVKCLLLVDTTLYAGMESGAIMVFNLTTRKEVRCFQATDRAIHSMTWTREGSTRLLCIGSEDSHIHVIDSSSGLPVRIIGGHTKTAFTLSMLDHFVLSGSGDRKVMAHNVHTAAFVWELHDHRGIVTSVCVDNGLLFSAGYDKIIRCYDLKSRKLLHLLYGAGKSIIMKMTTHNSVLYTGNRDGQVEAIDLRDVGSFGCECAGCNMVFGLKEHLWHHLVTDHLLPNSQAMRCPWSACSVMLDTGSALMKADEHIRSHIAGI